MARNAHPLEPAAPAATNRRLGAETLRSHAQRLASGFYDKYLSGDHVLDIGFRGGKADAVPVTDKAIGVELDYPGYDGVHLPFEDQSQDAVFASHCLEHIDDWRAILADWFRVLKIGGYLVIAVPHRQLYERKADLPSRFNGNHKRFYSPASLMGEIEAALPVGAWRLRSLRDNDTGFDYAMPPERHAKGCYEIELVVQRIATPAYAARLIPSPQAREAVRHFAALLEQALEAAAGAREADVKRIQALLAAQPLPSIRQLETILPRATLLTAAKLLRPIVAAAPFDEQDYLARYGDVRARVAEGKVISGHMHYITTGYMGGRFATPVPSIFM